jgi:phenylpropionate dioxygenase-like ring-hydroxylating dioxygenase large terminal subunit
VCGFHGWTYGLDGTCTHIREQDDWKGTLTPRNTHLAPVRVDTWGGWLFINMDPDCEPLADYLFPAAKILDPFGLEDMRYKWRKWLYFDCNWKVALEAFNETYHVFTTHPEFNQFGEFKGWARAQGKHSTSATTHQVWKDQVQDPLGSGDPRISTAEMQVYTMEETNATTTETLVNAAKRLVDELPEGTPADQVLAHWLTSARRDDEARGVIWPTIPGHPGSERHRLADFPELPDRSGLTSALCYSARPDPSYNPDKCIFEVGVFERYPKGEEPQTEWEYTPPDSPNWRSCCRRTSRTWPPCSRA